MRSSSENTSLEKGLKLMDSKKLIEPPKGARIWVEHPEKVWESATVTSDYRSGVLIVKLDQSDEVRQIKIKDESKMPPLRNPSLLIGQNDLTSLSYLHEPAVLHNLRVRFCDRNAIYTYCGIVLVAINPYYDLPIYGDETIMAYRGHAMGDLDPHIFAVSEEAYTKLERERRNQSIIVSGESGAGKTVSAKYAMRYFAAVGGNASETQVERKVIASSPLMEAIGNAKTTRNDNSSRFGKFIEIHFDSLYRISGASMRTYLLEKSRVVYQSRHERNYHIFYQICAARDMLPNLGLDHQDTFQYLNQGGSPNVDGVDDVATFKETKTALSTLGISEADQLNMFTVLAAILHLGNIEFVQSGKDDGTVSIDPEDKHLKHLCSLIGISKAEFTRWLTHRRIASAHEVIVAGLDESRAGFIRDALAKKIYGELFSWLVKQTNKALYSKTDAAHFIGVLDIYGFETFEINSFEQFCINYANEKLQQQFNSHVFKLEQDEYIKEEISWTMIEFYDNQPCIELIEERLGILALLDEECRVPNGSDTSLVIKLHDKCVHYKHYAKHRFNQGAFIIKHFADDVEYQAHGFLEKNRDTVSEEQIDCLRTATTCKLIREILSSNLDSPGSTATLPVPSRRKVNPNVPLQSLTQPPRRASGQKQTVGSQFRQSLSALMVTLSATTPHYVRCIKPNDDKAAFSFHVPRAVAQLRYRLLCKQKDLNRADIKGTCRIILNKYIKDADKFQFGATKIFFRAGQVAYLEKVRADIQRACCVVAQSCVRRFVARRRYVRVVRSVRAVQAHGRGYLARLKAQELRRNRAAITLQRYTRGWLCRREYLRLRRLAIGLQAVARGYLARRLYKNKKMVKAAILIQRNIRGFLSRQRAKRLKKHIIICQAAIRRFLARRQYKRLRIEARSLDHVKTLNKGLENKIISLQQRLEQSLEKNKQLEVLQRQIAELRTKFEALKPLEIQVKFLKEDSHEKNNIIHELKAALESEKDSNKRLCAEKREVEEKYRNEMDLWEEESAKLAREMRSNKEIFDQELAAQKRSYEQQKKALMEELEAERQSRQKLLSTQYELQESLDQLQRKSEKKEHKRSSSDASSNSQLETTVEDDYGYGSVRSVEATRPALEAVNWSAGNRPTSPSQVADSGLVLRMQNRISALQHELVRTSQRATDLEDRLASRLSAPSGNANVERFKLEELEIENKKMRECIERFQAAGDGIILTKEIIEQMAQMREELDRRRDECIQLKSVLTNQQPWYKALKNVTVNLKSLATSNYGSDVDIINEDGELATAYEAQKEINKQLQQELTAEKKFYAEHITELKAEINRLREDNEKYQKLLGAEIGVDTKTRGQEFAHIEIAKLAAENLATQERVEKLSESCRRYKNQIRILTNKLAEIGFQDIDGLLENNETSTTVTNAVSKTQMAPVVRKKEREYLGMFEYKIQDEPKIIKKLITDLKPSVAASLLPCLPAYILCMMLRHMDHVDDEPKMHQLLRGLRASVRKTLKRHPDSNENMLLWLANMLRLLNLLRQYSGDTVYQASNTLRQNQQCLRIFDLSEYRQLLSDTAVGIYQGLITTIQKQLERTIVPAILEHEEIRLGDAARPGLGASPAKLKQDLGSLLQSMHRHALHPDIQHAVFKQLFYFICAFSLNQLLLRKDLCCWAKGLQIRFNISHLENWIKEHLPHHGQKNVEELLTVLRPITQAVQLLQARKSMEDVQSTVDMCDNLTAMQVCKILNMYTPAEEYEVKVTREFISEIQKKMSERAGPNADKEPQNLLMDTKMIFSVQFPFDPSPIRLEDVELPEVLELSDLLTKI